LTTDNNKLITGQLQLSEQVSFSHSAGTVSSRPNAWMLLAAIAAGASLILTIRSKPWSAEESAPGSKPQVALALRLDINQASVRELELLPGIGTGRATRIIRLRRKTGGISSLQQLEALGKGTAERLEPYLLPLHKNENGPCEGN
jgi:DNA uptake protein ComE-like DNA-binding protein